MGGWLDIVTVDFYNLISAYTIFLMDIIVIPISEYKNVK